MTTRGSVFLFDSLAATYSVLARSIHLAAAAGCQHAVALTPVRPGNRDLGTELDRRALRRSKQRNRVQLNRRILALTSVGSLAMFSNQARRNINMGYGNRDKPERKSGRAGFVDARLEELRRRWENATDEREKTEVSEQIREWQSFKPERSAPFGGRR